MLTVTGWIIWNAGSLTSPNFQPKEIYPPALQAAELTETVYATRAEAQDAINAHGGPHNYSAAGAAGGLGSGVVGPAGQAAQNSSSGLAAIGDFFSRLAQANTWIRVAEVVLGLALLSIGFARITGTTSAVEKIAARVPGVPL